MSELREQAMKHILMVEKLKEQHAELEDLAAALIEPFSDSHFAFGSDIEIGVWDKRGMKCRVLLEQDLGITNIQEELRGKVLAVTKDRKVEIENELKKLIGGNE